MATRNYLCPGCEKRLKSIHGLTRHINTCTSYQVIPIYMQPKQNTSIPGEKANFRPYKDEKLILKEQNFEEDHINLGDKSSDTKSRVRNGLARCTSQAGLLGSELSSSLREVRFSD